MVIGTYIDGRHLLFDHDSNQFFIGEAPVTPESVKGWDAHGQITWTDALTKDAWLDWIDALGGHLAAAEANALLADAVEPSNLDTAKLRQAHVDPEGPVPPPQEEAPLDARGCGDSGGTHVAVLVRCYGWPKRGIG